MFISSHHHHHYYLFNKFDLWETFLRRYTKLYSSVLGFFSYVKDLGVVVFLIKKLNKQTYVLN